MAHYLVQASYSNEAVANLVRNPQDRAAMLQGMAESWGGNMEAFYFAFGEADAFVIVELPDNATAAALSMAVNASGVVGLKTHVLLTPEEVDQAAKKSVKYRAPGKR